MFKFYHSVSGSDKWEEITELELHAILYKYVRQTTPSIKKMLKGSIISLNDEEFKIEKC